MNRFVSMFAAVATAALLGHSASAQELGGATPEQALRKFDTLCSGQDAQGKSSVHARFLPNIFDYHTKPSPAAPITRGEHVRSLLILTNENVSGIIDRVRKAGLKQPFILMQLTEMEKAQDAFARFEGDPAALPSCAAPFPGPQPD